jgi:hypothetical protein
MSLANIPRIPTKKLKKEETKKQGNISAYFTNGDLSDYDDEQENDNSENSDEGGDPSKLCDIQFMQLLKFCDDLKKNHKETDEVQDGIMMNQLELGKQDKLKTLIFDMDETLIAAKLAGREPEGFVTDFAYDFMGRKISVRFRPYL